MPPVRLNAALEALLFSSDQPLPLDLMSEALETSTDEVRAGLHALGELYASRSAGVELREIAGGWMLVTTAEQSEWVGRLLRGKRKMRLSRAALETLAIIAYKQPVTKSEVEAIRGVDSSGVLATLMERNLVTIRGRSKVVGRPLLYGSTPEFLDYFGLRDLAELPRPEELRALVAAREPEQLEMIELEVVSQVASNLAAAEALEAGKASRRAALPLEAEPPTEDERELAASGDEEDERDDDDELDEDALEDDELDDEPEQDELDEDEIEDETAAADDEDEAGDDEIIDDEVYDEVDESAEGSDDDEDDEDDEDFEDDDEEEDDEDEEADDEEDDDEEDDDEEDDGADDDEDGDFEDDEDFPETEERLDPLEEEDASLEGEDEVARNRRSKASVPAGPAGDDDDPSDPGRA